MLPSLTLLDTVAGPTDNMCMKLLIVDDHPVLRDGLAALLQQAGPDTTVLQARDASEGLRLSPDGMR